MQSPSENKRVGVYTYMAQWPIYALAWSVRHDKKHRLAIGSFLEDYSNKVELVQFNLHTCDFSTDNRLIFDHPYAPTNIMFFPSEDSANPDIVATSGDYLRLWQIYDDRIELKSLFNGNKSSEFNSAITSFDWADFDVRRVATSSVDTTFSGDGSVRVFDLRDKERSTIIYENPIQECPLLRLEWNKCDPRFVATVGMDSNKVVVLDIRFPTTPLMELCKHKASVNAISWASVSGRQICSAGDDSRALIWEVVDSGHRSENGFGGDMDPDMWYGSTAEINNVRWSPVHLDWIAVAFLNKLQLLKV
ncbi:hypothetical protein GH714_030655 [Hevea brasiliensis]|uniref:Uncharacterized protein n=1 Tax=Hevea brasiliensis TaxID=3981 RepID=A0A6A6M548_HEVBR|nr:hypothetical protein GH714_030655 [Hevea brasiliensis]